LHISAYQVNNQYPTGFKISAAAMEQLQLRPHETQPTRNYTLSPR
jgi:hypothetical protein